MRHYILNDRITIIAHAEHIACIDFPAEAVCIVDTFNRKPCGQVAAADFMGGIVYKGSAGPRTALAIIAGIIKGKRISAVNVIITIFIKIAENISGFFHKQAIENKKMVGGIMLVVEYLQPESLGITIPDTIGI